MDLRQIRRDLAGQNWRAMNERSGRTEDEAQACGRRRWLITALVLTVTAAATSIYAARDIKLRYDTLRYALVAEQIVAGQGIKLSVLPHWREPDPSGLTPYTLQPPGYPLVLAAMGGIQLDRMWPGRVINVVGHVTIVWCVWLITCRLVGFWVGSAAGFYVAICYPLLFVASMMLSEVMYIALSMGCLLGVVMAAGSDRRGAWLAVAAVTAAGAIATRLSGVVLLPILAWQMLVTLRCRGGRAALSSAAALALPLIVLALLLARNWVQSGELGGIPIATHDQSVGVTVGQTLGALGELLALKVASIKSQVLVGLVMLTVVVLLIRLRRRTDVQVWRNGLDSVLLAAVLYYGFLVSSYYRYVLFVEPRYFVPLMPMLVIILFVLLAKGWGSLTIAGRTWVGKAALVGTIVYCLAFCGYDTFARWPLRADIPDKREIISRSMRVLAPVQDHLRPGEGIASNREIEIAFATGRPTMRLAMVRANFDWQMPEDASRWLSERMAVIDARYLVLVAPAEGLNERTWGAWLAGLSRREDAAPPFTRIWQSHEGVIYELKQ